MHTELRLRGIRNVEADCLPCQAIWALVAVCGTLQASFRISANIAVARQLFRHQVGLTVNETSRRYVNGRPGV